MCTITCTCITITIIWARRCNQENGPFIGAIFLRAAFLRAAFFAMLHRENRAARIFFKRWFVAPLLPIGLRPSVPRLSPGIAVGHVATGRAPPKIGLVRQVIGIVAGITLSERRVPRRRIIIGLRRRARNNCGGQSSSQKKCSHSRLRDFRCAGGEQRRIRMSSSLPTSI